ncbi:putative ubiquitin carboxyl-terminal hydrolase isozyme l3 protein [Botrytis fragariae]|uniref:Ubiquitin carboxyl-terminal hydrolase n=1 Tax=Botrytis fragariae TaxID=1964551 RepID=A0A8H6AV84_9HELO|nr:putative ubiquitin carboxyl-terminal hydrolase isozyme l3 protein [Botrytis fragariae]KAF5874025.1 putative ubiquitin carboxyl-terminal hydrolase isozyme l3 protein [Botrytis fragariae]
MPIPATFHNGKKTFTVLENNPEVMNALAKKLGLSPDLAFYDVYSLTDSGLLSIIPRPVHALLVILPLTPSWNTSRLVEDTPLSVYEGSGSDEPVIWFKQTIGHACGSIGLLHCLINGPTKPFILPDTTLSRLREQAIPLKMEERAKILYDDKEFEDAHQSVAEMGDTAAPSASEGDRLGQHFVAFVKGDDGHLWELEGSRKGPLDRGLLPHDEDALSENAIAKGIGRVIRMEEEAGGGDLRFSCIALAKVD